MKKIKTTGFFDNIPLDTKIIKEKKSTEEGITAKKFLEEYYVPRYTELFEIPPKINWGKDIKLIKSLIKTYKDLSIFGIETHYDFLIKVCEKYFISNDALALRSAWSIGVFYTNFQKLTFLLKHSTEKVTDQVIDGYKKGFLNFFSVELTESLIGKEEIFSQIYIFIKPLWTTYGKDFSLVRFSEIYFLVLFEHMKKSELTLEFFISKYAMGFFGKWLEGEGKEILMFIPKGIGNMTKEQLEIEELKLVAEERALINR